MIGRFFTIVISLAVLFGMSTLLISGLGIIIGVTNKHVVQPIYAKITDPRPLYVDDPRCCR